MGRKLLVICGPTATGKTRLALHLAKKFNGEIVSADSRQVYCFMNIGTGKDIPKGFEFRISNLGFKGGEVGFYTDGDTRIWGYDFIKPTEEFSVAKYVKIANKIINEIWKPRQKLTHSGGQGGKLPILVGGTGLYIKGVVDGIPTAAIPKSEALRKTLEGKKSGELFELLAQLDPVRAASMNASDRKNPRRLTRAIEIAELKSENKQSLALLAKELRIKNLSSDTLFIGLTAPKNLLKKKIDDRVERRFKQGIENEIRSLFQKGVTWRHQSMQALGYKQWLGFFENKKSQQDVVLNWKRAEKKFAKRQMTWFKRDKRINWFDISKLGWDKDVERLVGKWYSSEKRS